MRRKPFPQCGKRSTRATGAVPSRPRPLPPKRSTAIACSSTGSPHCWPSPHRHDDPPIVRCRSVLPEIDALPRAQLKLTGTDGNHEGSLREHGANVRGHVIGSLGIMLVARIAIRRDAAHEGLEVASDARVPVLPGKKRCARVRHEHVAHAVRNTAVAYHGEQILGYLSEAPTARVYCKLSPMHIRASADPIIPLALRRMDITE